MIETPVLIRGICSHGMAKRVGAARKIKMKQRETISMWEDIASTGMLQRAPKGRFLIMIFSFSGSSPMSSLRIPEIVVVQLFSIISS